MAGGTDTIAATSGIVIHRARSTRCTAYRGDIGLGFGGRQRNIDDKEPLILLAAAAASALRSSNRGGLLRPSAKIGAHFPEVSQNHR
jgi:hypothetical protein